MSNNFFIFGPLALIGLTLLLIAVALFVMSLFQRDPVPRTNRQFVEPKEAAESSSRP